MVWWWSRVTGESLFEEEMMQQLCCASSLNHIQLFVAPRTVAHQVPLSMAILPQECWSASPCPPPGDLPSGGIEPRSPTLQVDSLLSEPPGKPWWSRDLTEVKSHRRPVSETTGQRRKRTSPERENCPAERQGCQHFRSRVNVGGGGAERRLPDSREKITWGVDWQGLWISPGGEGAVGWGTIEGFRAEKWHDLIWVLKASSGCCVENRQ